MKRNVLIVALFAMAGSGCLKEGYVNTNFRVEVAYAFDSDAQGWTVGYADYPVGLSTTDSTDLYEMKYGWGDIPDVTPAEKGIMVSGNNKCDDLFMYIKKKITGLEPGRNYAISFDIDIASNVKTNALGVGGAPGEDVIVKAGAKSFEPTDTIDGQNWYRLNLDKGNQKAIGKDMMNLGHVGVSDNAMLYSIINRKSSNAMVVKANTLGEIWVIVGTDSGFEGLTKIYYSEIRLFIESLQ